MNLLFDIIWNSTKIKGMCMTRGGCFFAVSLSFLTQHEQCTEYLHFGWEFVYGKVKMPQTLHCQKKQLVPGFPM